MLQSVAALLALGPVITGTRQAYVPKFVTNETELAAYTERRARTLAKLGRRDGGGKHWGSKRRVRTLKRGKRSGRQ